MELEPTLAARVHAHQLGHLLPLLSRVARPTVRFDLAPAEAPAALGSSRVGGQPDLPPEAAWPLFQGRPLVFVAQVDLAAVAPHLPDSPLPPDGLLSFFADLAEMPASYDPACRASFQARYTAAGTPLRRHATPLPDYELPASAMAFAPCLTLPHESSQHYDKLIRPALPSPDDEQLWELNRTLAAAYSPAGHETNHQLLGYSFNIQGDMQREAQLVTNGINCGGAEAWSSPEAQALLPGAGEWELLFQLDSDDQAELLWDDNGILYFWIRREDLRERRFDRVWGCEQDC
ncbi:MAG TPA: YwqG family protein [Herpetosiphonaceae bacterium]